MRETEGGREGGRKRERDENRQEHITYKHRNIIEISCDRKKKKN